MSKVIKIGDHSIGLGYPPFIVAEMSGNHNQSLERALEIVDAAARAGVHAIKLQTYTADTLTMDIEKDEFYIDDPKSLWKGSSLYDLYKQSYTPWEWHKPIFEHCRRIGITIFSTPFDESAVDLLEDLNTPAYKIASFEAIDLPLIKYVAKTRKPMIISTGMADVEEISEAVETARDGGCADLILLHCISGYPAPVEQSNLRTIKDLADRFSVISGLSDHTLGITVSVTSVALGACVVEKHFTLRRQDKGPDSEFSLEPDELRSLCQESKNAWLALGKAGYERKPAEEANLKFRRSIYVVKDMKAGEYFTENNVRSIRPSHGLPPKYLKDVLGKKAKTDIKRGTPLTQKLIQQAT